MLSLGQTTHEPTRQQMDPRLSARMTTLSHAVIPAKAGIHVQLCSVQNLIRSAFGSDLLASAPARTAF
jgi:hypothetical protein